MTGMVRAGLGWGWRLVVTTAAMWWLLNVIG